MDESGVLASPSAQRFFALGVLLVDDAALLTNRLHGLKSRLHAVLGDPPRPVEFKFNAVTKTAAPAFHGLIDAVLEASTVQATILLLDKQASGIGRAPGWSTAWDAYVQLAQLALSSSVGGLGQPQRCVVVADYLTKPGSSAVFLEHALRESPSVDNAFLIESEASLLVQAIDVLVGCVVYAFRIKEGEQATDPVKRELVTHLTDGLGLQDLARACHTSSPVRFTIWPLHEME